MYTTKYSLDILKYLLSLGCRHIDLGTNYIEFYYINDKYMCISLNNTTRSLYTYREFKERVNAHINKRAIYLEIELC